MLIFSGTENEIVERKKYSVYNEVDRARIVEAANKGEDWSSLASSFGINYKTAYTWVRSGRVESKRRGGGNEKRLSEDEVDTLIRWVEEDPTITLKNIAVKVQAELQKDISKSSVANYLDGRLYTIKNVHNMPANMNSAVNKNKRAEFVTALSGYIQQGKQIVYLDETNFNLFCRRTKGRARSGTRAVLTLPPSRGPNVHLIGAISTSGVLSMETRRGSFKKESAAEWVRGLFEKWTSMGNVLSDLVLVCDNTPCHAGLEQVVGSNGSPILLRLGPYSPMLNPIENVWAKKQYTALEIYQHELGKSIRNKITPNHECEYDNRPQLSEVAHRNFIVSKEQQSKLFYKASTDG
ncbi:uncharacterized protein LOC118752589, partial [Rhagoletis pomonella]|uniref:uncharacterized protein LOC118752589 n=1 Tax=Rhagoletis pomonella TaxID=28610 RepID=UPI001786ACDE